MKIEYKEVRVNLSNQSEPAPVFDSSSLDLLSELSLDGWKLVSIYAVGDRKSPVAILSREK